MYHYHGASAPRCPRERRHRSADSSAGLRAAHEGAQSRRQSRSSWWLLGTGHRGRGCTSTRTLCRTRTAHIPVSMTGRIGLEALGVWVCLHCASGYRAVAGMGSRGNGRSREWALAAHTHKQHTSAMPRGPAQAAAGASLSGRVGRQALGVRVGVHDCWVGWRVARRMARRAPAGTPLTQAPTSLKPKGFLAHALVSPPVPQCTCGAS
jgi:hypothetical protein